MGNVLYFLDAPGTLYPDIPQMTVWRMCIVYWPNIDRNTTE